MMSTAKTDIDTDIALKEINTNKFFSLHISLPLEFIFVIR